MRGGVPKEYESKEQMKKLSPHAWGVYRSYSHLRTQV